MLLRRLALDPEPLIGNLVYTVQGKEEWLIIWAGFYPKDALNCHLALAIEVHFRQSMRWYNHGQARLRINDLEARNPFLPIG